MPPTGQPAPKKTCPRQTQELRSIHHVLIQAWYPTHSHLHSPPDPHPAPLGRMDRPTKLTRGKGEPQPCALADLFRRKKRLEDLGELVGWDARARIRQRDRYEPAWPACVGPDHRDL